MPRALASKNKEGSSQSLIMDSSFESNHGSINIMSHPHGKTNEDSKRMSEITTIVEEKDNDHEQESAVNLPIGVQPVVERTLDQLNQTMTLIKKVAASTKNQSKLNEYTDNKEYITEATDDRKHLIMCKNLPSIRDKLFSIKSKQQKANLNPKYNRRGAPPLKDHKSLS